MVSICNNMIILYKPRGSPLQVIFVAPICAILLESVILLDA